MWCSLPESSEILRLKTTHICGTGNTLGATEGLYIHTLHTGTCALTLTHHTHSCTCAYTCVAWPWGDYKHVWLGTTYKQHTPMGFEPQSSEILILVEPHATSILQNPPQVVYPFSLNPPKSSSCSLAIQPQSSEILQNFIPVFILNPSKSFGLARRISEDLGRLMCSALLFSWTYT